MKCSLHICDLSSAVGVCASCLRERLFALIDSHNEEADESRYSDAYPPLTLAFPRSVSPYVSHMKPSEKGYLDRHSFSAGLSYCTPHAGPESCSKCCASSATTSGSSKKKHRGRFSLFSGIFRSRTGKPAPEFEPTASTSSPLKWFPFSSVVHSRRKKQQQSGLYSLDGASPAAHGRFEQSETSPSTDVWKSPATVRRNRGRQLNMPSGLVFCLSPLVRTTAVPPEFGFSGEPRSSHRCRRLSNLGRIAISRRSPRHY